MTLGLRTIKYQNIKPQLLSLLDVRVVDISDSNTYNLMNALVNLDKTAVSTYNSIRNIDVQIFDETVELELQQPIETKGTPSLKLLHGMITVEQYEHLSQLPYLQNSVRYKR